MEQAFLDYIKQQQLFSKNERILIAASAGIDSTVLCFLMKDWNYPFGLAHCNFLLRGKSSDEDEQFTKELAKYLDVSYYTTSFDTAQVAKTKKQSIQIAARELRYAWLEEIRQTHGFDYIATAHHLNDSIETTIYNFAKGCGIRGLHGISPKLRKVVRPLLFATKAEIETYAEENEVPFREDASNASDKYARNKIRHHVMPTLKSINPSLEQSAGRTIQNLVETEQLFDFLLKEIKKKILKEENNITTINSSKLLEYPAPSTVLFELVRTYNFPSDQIRQLVAHLDNSGSRYYSSTHELLVNRGEILIRKKPVARTTVFEIKATVATINLGDVLLNMEHDVPPPKHLGAIPANVAYFDTETLSFPLKVRHWQAGDWFQPLGMKGKRQKLKDFFTHQKLSIFEKEDIWLLESQGDICWIIGKRIDERFKITNTTKNCVRISFHNQH